MTTITNFSSPRAYKKSFLSEVLGIILSSRVGNIVFSLDGVFGWFVAPG